MGFPTFGLLLYLWGLNIAGILYCISNKEPPKPSSNQGPYITHHFVLKV